MSDWMPAVTSGTGLLKTGINILYNEHNKLDEKQWWYEQQKYLEEHNSPAYQRMLMDKAGLSPYASVSSQPLGNVDSSLPHQSLPFIDESALVQSLVASSTIDKNQAEANKANAEAGYTAEKTQTETEWRSNIIQQTINLQQSYQLGLITEEERDLELTEYKKALANGYNGYLIEQDLAESTKQLNQSIISLNEAKEKREEQEALNLAVQHAALTLQLELDSFFEPLFRQAELDKISLDVAFDQAQFEEWLDLQDTRQSLYNVQKVFAKFAVDEAARHDALARIVNENDKYVAESLLDAANDGDKFKFVLLKMFAENPGSSLQSLTNVLTAFAPNYNINRNSTTINKISK